MARLADMDAEGIDRAVLYPSVGLYVWAVPDPAAAVSIARAYNDWLASYCTADRARLFGAAMVPVQDPEAAVAELRRAHDELGFPAAFLRPNPSCGRSLSDPAYEPIWAAAEEVGMTIGIHEGSSVIVPTLGSDRPFNPLILHAVSHAFEQMLACAELIAFGVLDRHPGLRVVFLESGGGWAPFWMERLDEQAESFGAFCPQMTPGPERVLRPPVLDLLRDRRDDPSRPGPHHRDRPGRAGVRTIPITTPPSRGRSPPCAGPSPPWTNRPGPGSSGPTRPSSTGCRLGLTMERWRWPAAGRCSGPSWPKRPPATATPRPTSPPTAALSPTPSLHRLSDEVAGGLLQPGASAPETWSASCFRPVPPTPWPMPRRPRSGPSPPG